MALGSETGGSRIGARMEQVNHGARQAARQAAIVKQRQDARDEGFRARLAPEVGRLSEAKTKLRTGASGVLYLACMPKRKISESLTNLGSFSAGQQESWRRVFDGSQVIIPDGKIRVSVNELVTPDDVHGATLPFTVDALDDPFFGRKPTTFSYDAYLPTEQERGAGALSSFAEGQRDLNRRFGGVVPGLSSLALRSARKDLTGQSLRVEGVVARNAETSESLAEVFAAGIIAVGLDPSKFADELQTGLPLASAVTDMIPRLG